MLNVLSLQMYKTVSGRVSYSHTGSSLDEKGSVRWNLVRAICGSRVPSMHAGAQKKSIQRGFR